MSQGMTVRELREALAAHNDDGALVLIPDMGSEKWHAISMVSASGTWHVVDERTTVAFILAHSAPTPVSLEPLPPETVTVEIPREAAEFASDFPSRSFDERFRPIAEACRKALGTANDAEQERACREASGDWMGT